MSSAIAAIPDDTVAIPVKTKRIPKRIAEVVHLLVSGECKTIKAAAERTGMHPNYVSGALKKPEIQVFIERSARQTITNGLLRASARVNELVDASSEHVSFEASKHVLAIAGIKPTADAQVSVNIDIKAGYVIDLTDKPDRVTDARLTRGNGVIIDNDEIST
jgi:hypothetical protein